jgi:hypothetical protein
MNLKNRILLALLNVCVVVSAGAKAISKKDARAKAAKIIEINDASTDDVDNAPYYVFSRGEGKGYVIVSGDDRTTFLLAYTDRGNFNYETEAEPLKEMLDEWAKTIENLQMTTTEASRAKKARRKVESFKSNWTSVSPLLQTHWHQDRPYNILCPIMSNGNQTITGCEATAGAQIVYYFRKDNRDTTIYDTPTYSYGTPVKVSYPAGTPIKYSRMRLSGSGTPEQDTAVATLMITLGTSAWLTYGSSTSGETAKMGTAMRGQFALNNDYKQKAYYTQTDWESMVYRNLAEGRPMLYAGSNDDGGHAIVLDGYDEKTGMYHFNFGWGGQSDGYYTLNDTTGINGFCKWQEALMNITPKKQNMTAKLTTDKFYSRTTSNITAKIHNNGTLSYSGFKLYISTTNTMPSTATYTENQTSVASGDSMSFSYAYQPVATAKIIYVFLCDNNGNLLDSCSVNVNKSKSDLHLLKLAVNSGDKKEVVDGYTFYNVGNTTAKVTATLRNGKDGSYCQPFIRCYLEKYDTSAKTWSNVDIAFFSDMTFNTNEEKDTTFIFSGLSENTYYRAYMQNWARTTQKDPVYFDTADSIVYFTVTRPDLAINYNSGREATVTGTWNADVWATIAPEDAKYTAYDFTAVKELTEKPALANDNAIILASQAVEGATNIVVNGICDSLVIYSGQPFAPKSNFTAKTARMEFDGAKAGKWGNTIIPFAASIPMGMQVRAIDGIKTSALTLNNVAAVNAMTPVMYMISCNKNNFVSAKNVVITTDTFATALDNKVIGYTVDGIKTDGTQYLCGLNSNGAPVFTKATEGTAVDAFAIMLYGTNTTTGHRALNTLSVDGKYCELADSINSAYTLYNNVTDREASARETFAAAILSAAEYFTTAAATTANDVENQTNALTAAMSSYMSAATGIENISANNKKATDDNWYTLQGVRLASEPTQHGIFIHNGKKIIK